MRRILAELFNSSGNVNADAGKSHRAEHLYKLASRIDPRWSVPWYNLGLLAKNNARWEDSLTFNQRAASLSSDDQAAWWNLGIAATALHNWSIARQAWTACGIELMDGTGEVAMPPATACVRLNPSHSGEVVWGERLDPARFVIMNVPLPESEHRFHDIVLNDGAENGTRELNTMKVPVFDELAIWKRSKYSTFRVNIRAADASAPDSLLEFCRSRKLGLEDWSSIRILCDKCSRGNPGPHDCPAIQEEGSQTFGLAAQTRDEAIAALRDWKESVNDAEFGDPELVVDATVH
jgi:tetratricopeptide (TPR) repeat protein